MAIRTSSQSHGFGFLEMSLCLVILTSATLIIIGISDYLLTYLRLQSIISSSTRALRSHTSFPSMHSSHLSPLVDDLESQIQKVVGSSTDRNYVLQITLSTPPRSQVIAQRGGLLPPLAPRPPPLLSPSLDVSAAVIPRIAQLYLPSLAPLVVHEVFSITLDQ